MKTLLKVLCGFLGFIVLLIVMVIMMFAGVGSGGIGSIASPLPAFATEDEAYAYQYIGSELGVPWDVIMLADAIHAYEAGAGDLSGYNPMLTSLEFCIIVEEEMVPKLQDVSGGDAGSVSGGDAGVAPDEEWETREIRYYTGKEEILEYIGLREDGLTYQDATEILNVIDEVTEEKSMPDLKYEATLTVNPEYEEVLRNFIGLEEETITYAMALYDARYIETLYGYVGVYDVELPDIVLGDVTREELAQVAISLIGHPYKMGGKSNEAGPPTGPLDCSGFVDWVYYQCFGMRVSSGQIPADVAVSGTAQQWYASEEIRQSELKVGDLCFLYDPATMSKGQINHVGIYIGTYNGNAYIIHCAGSAYGTTALPNGRVGISRLDVSNNYNPVDGSTFDPPMKNCRFRYFRRPRFVFSGE